MKNSVLFLLCLALPLNTGATMAGDSVPVSFTRSTTETFSTPDLGSLAVAWHPSGNFVALSGNGETRVYAVPSAAGEQLAEVVRFQHGDQSRFVVFSNSGNVLTTVDTTGNGRFWYLKRALDAYEQRGDSNGRAILNNPVEFATNRPDLSFTWNLNSTFFAHGGDQGGVHLSKWGRPSWSYAGLAETRVRCIRFIRGQINGRSNLLAISAGNTVKIWRGGLDPEHLRSHLARENPEQRLMNNDDLLGALTHVRYVERDGRRVRELVAPGTMEFARDGNTLAVAFSDVVKLWNPFTGATAITASHGSEVRCIDWSADGSSLVTVTTDGKIRQWDSGGNAMPGLDMQGNVYYARFSPDGKRLLVGQDDAFTILSFDVVPN